MRRNVYRPLLWSLLIVFVLSSLGCTSSENHSIYMEDASISIDRTYTASVPALSVRERAIIDQGQGEYVGVDDWMAHDPLAAGTRIVNGGTSNLLPGVGDFSQRNIVSYSSYFATEAARDASISGGILDTAFYNGLVQVGPWRQGGTTGDFGYRRFGITYEVVRPMPVTRALALNNPQMDTTGAPGGAEQYFAPFIRQDLLRLGYIKLVDAVDSTVASRVSAIPRYVALKDRTATQTELNQLALTDYTARMAERTADQQALAARLRSESISLRTTKPRSVDTFTARANSGDLSLGAAARIDGYATVNLAASRNITLQGTVWGMDRFTSTAGSTCAVASGGLVESWTDRLVAGDQALLMTCGTVQIGGRVQSQAGAWKAWNEGVPGKIVLTTSNADSAATGIAVTGQGQVLALLQTSQTDKGLNSVRMISPGSSIEIDGLGYGFNVVADKGTIDIENTGASGAVRIFDKAALSADVVKAGALGTLGTLVITAGSNLDANDLIKLFGGITGGKITFRGAGDVILTSGNGTSPIIISADTVEVETGTRLVTRSWVQDPATKYWSRIDATAQVYCNQCNWNTTSGGTPAPGYEGTWTVAPTRAGPPAADRIF